MSYSRRSRDSYYSHSPYRGSRSVSRSLSRLRSRSRSLDSTDVDNPGNNLYVTGLSRRVTTKELEKHFSSEGGKVVDVHLVTDPWTRESRGFGFVTMETVEDANRCLKHLDRSVLQGRVITVEKARRRRGRTPTPGRYLGAKTIQVRRRSPSYSPYSRGRYSSPRHSSRRDQSYSPYYSQHRSRYSRSSSYSSGRDRSYSPYYGRGRSRCRSPSYGSRDGSYSPYYKRSSYYRSPSYSPERRRSDSPFHSYPRSYSRYDYRRSPSRRGDCYYSSYRSWSWSRSYRKQSVLPYYRHHRCSISSSASPRSRRSSRSHLSRSYSPVPRRPLSREASPSERDYSRSPRYSRSCSGSYSRSWSRSASSHSRSPSRSPSSS